jgi:hypothetical protein
MIKYLNALYQYTYSIYRYLLSKIQEWHEKLRNGGWYQLLGFEFANIVITGFLISIALMALRVQWNPWLIISYGLLPWLIVQLLVYAKKQLK